MKKVLIILAGVALLFLAACQSKASGCQEATGTLNLSIPPEALPSSIPPTNSFPLAMKVGGKAINVDQVIEGPLCNGSWSGTVYVSCNVQVYPWKDKPTFLKNCKLKIAPGTVVYVAYHHDSAYYNGCSCHTGEITGP
jgi:hypothetical protein